MRFDEFRISLPATGFQGQISKFLIPALIFELRPGFLSFGLAFGSFVLIFFAQTIFAEQNAILDRYVLDQSLCLSGVVHPIPHFLVACVELTSACNGDQSSGAA